MLEAEIARLPPLVHRGQAVTLIAHAGNLNVRAPGISMADGGLNERVKVRNSTSSRLLEGVVRSAETVEVLLE